LGEPTFAAAWESGRTLPLPGALAYALGPERVAAAPSLAAPTPTDARADRAPGAQGSDALTPREREVAALVASGHTNRQIAEKLVISERTVEWHVSKLLARLELQSRAHLAVWAIDHGIAAAE
jgi:DNA-binding NarL/FixJ family response regulator